MTSWWIMQSEKKCQKQADSPVQMEIQDMTNPEIRQVGKMTHHESSLVQIEEE
jgi:hypothetical protein